MHVVSPSLTNLTCACRLLSPVIDSLISEPDFWIFQIVSNQNYGIRTFQGPESVTNSSTLVQQI